MIRETFKRNTFFARFLVTNSNIPGYGDGFVIEHYFTTRNIYMFKSSIKAEKDLIENKLRTVECEQAIHVDTTSNGLLILPDDIVESAWQGGYFGVDFKLRENNVNMFTLEDIRVYGLNNSGADFESAPISDFTVVAYAIGTMEYEGHINNLVSGIDNTCWVSGTDTILRDSLFPSRIRSNKFSGKTAFAHPTFLPRLPMPMGDVDFIQVYTGESPAPVVSDCCDSGNRSQAIMAATILVASGNPITPVLIKRIEDAVESDFDLQSTVSALQSMRQLGTLSNMTGKVLDNIIQKDISGDVIINNGRDVL